MSADLPRIRGLLQRWTEGRNTHPASALPRACAYLEELLEEVAEHRAARGIEAPAGWGPSDDALWERPVGDGSRLLVADHPYPGLFLWTWWAPGAARAEGTEVTCLGAMAAAEAALAGREGA